MSSRAARPIDSYHWQLMPVQPRHRLDGRRCKRCGAGGYRAPRAFWSHQSLPVAHRVAGGYFPRLDASRAPEAVAGAHQVQAFAYRQAGQRRGAHAPCAGPVLKDGPRPDHHRAMRIPIDS